MIVVDTVGHNTSHTSDNQVTKTEYESTEHHVLVFDSSAGHTHSGSGNNGARVSGLAASVSLSTNMTLTTVDSTRDVIISTDGGTPDFGPNLMLRGSASDAVPSIQFQYGATPTNGMTMFHDSSNGVISVWNSAGKFQVFTYSASNPNGDSEKLRISPGENAESAFGNVTYFRVYSDDFSTEEFAINGQTGEVFVNDDLNMKNGHWLYIWSGDLTGQTFALNGATGEAFFKSHVEIATGLAIRTPASNAKTFSLAAYDGDGAAFRNFLTLTSADNPSITLGSTTAATTNTIQGTWATSSFVLGATTFGGNVNMGTYQITNLEFIRGFADTSSVGMRGYVTGGAPATANILFYTGNAANPQVDTLRLTIGSNAATVDIDITNADLDIGANKIKTTTYYLTEYAGGTSGVAGVALKRISDNVMMGITAGNVALVDGGGIYPVNVAAANTTRWYASDGTNLTAVVLVSNGNGANPTWQFANMASMNFNSIAISNLKLGGAFDTTDQWIQTTGTHTYIRGKSDGTGYVYFGTTAHLQSYNILDVTGIYGDATNGLILRANTATTDATERNMYLQTLDATGDAWVSLITLVPNSTSPYVSFNSKNIKAINSAYFGAGDTTYEVISQAATNALSFYTRNAANNASVERFRVSGTAAQGSGLVSTWEDIDMNSKNIINLGVISPASDVYFKLADTRYGGYTESTGGTWIWQISETSGSVIMNPIATNITILDFTLETEWTYGTCIYMNWDSATTLGGATTGWVFDAQANVTATGRDVTGTNIKLPNVTNTGAGTYGYRGLDIDCGTMVQNTGAGTSLVYGIDIAMAAITQTTGSVTTAGINLVMSTATTAGYGYGIRIYGGVSTNFSACEAIHIEMNAAADTAINTNAQIIHTGLPAFAASDKYVVIDASGHLHVSALGPAS